MRRKRLRVTAMAALAMFLVLFGTAGAAGKEITDAGGQWKYVLEDGGATITGYVEEPSGHLVIPNALDGHAVTSIGDRVFNNCTRITDISIPNSVTAFGDSVFTECIKLTSVTIPDSVTRISDGAFYACWELTNVTIPDSVTSINAWAFGFCGKLINITIPSSVVSIGDDAFKACDYLIFAVEAGSYAEEYAKANGIPCTYGETDAQQSGQAALKAEANEYALSIYDAALIEHPDVAAYHGGRGEALSCLEHYEEAIESLNTAMRLDPGFYEYVNNRGVAYYFMGRLDEALADFQKAIELDPAKPMPYYNLAYVQNEMGHPENAALTCTRGLTAFPEYAELWILLGDVRSSLGEDREALYAYDKAISFGNYTAGDISGYDQVESGAAGGGTNTANPEPQIIAVSTAEELIDAIGSNTTIVLSDGVYNLSETSQGEFFTDEKFWYSDGDTRQLVIQGVHNLTIQGESPDCRIVVEPRDAKILLFSSCSGITMENITVGHTPGGSCMSGVLYFEDCSGIRLQNCHMFGCGASGLEFDSVSDVLIENSSIYECTYEIMEVIGGRNISFVNCVFRDIQFYGSAVTINGTENFTIDNCQFSNLEGRVLFNVEESSKIVVKNSSFTDIIADDLDPSGCISFQNNTFPVVKWSHERRIADERVKTDASGQWKYLLEDGEAVITEHASEPAGDLVIPGELDGYPVTGIGGYAFSECEGLTSVIIPEGVKSIGENAFTESGISSVTIPRSVTSIGYEAFACCENLTQVIIPDGVTSIGGYAFAFVERGLTSVIMPDSVTSVGYGAFMNCESLTSATISGGMTRIEDHTFYGCGRLTSVIIPDSVTSIGFSAFWECGEELTLSVIKGSYAEQYAREVRIPSVFIGDADETEGEEDDEPIPREAEEITVGTAEELLAALGSNRRILLKEGVYNLTAAEPGFQSNAHVYFSECYDGLELTLHKVRNLTIQGAGDGQSEIVVEPRYAFVMDFSNCSNVNIVNIKAGHTVAVEECGAGVFQFRNSAGVQMDGVLLYGCGSVGLSLGEAKDVKVAGSTIYECTEGIMEIYDSSAVLLIDCVFRDSTGDTMVYADNTSDLTIDSCSFLRNAKSDAMFWISRSKNVLVKNTEFADNNAKELVDQDANDIEMDASNRFENNTFDMTR